MKSGRAIDKQIDSTREKSEGEFRALVWCTSTNNFFKVPYSLGDTWFDVIGHLPWTEQRYKYKGLEDSDYQERVDRYPKFPFDAYLFTQSALGFSPTDWGVIELVMYSDGTLGPLLPTNSFPNFMIPLPMNVVLPRESPQPPALSPAMHLWYSSMELLVHPIIHAEHLVDIPSGAAKRYGDKTISIADLASIYRSKDITKEVDLNIALTVVVS
jgi:hypothetical protein